MPDQQRIAKVVDALHKATQAHARQYVQYQLTDKNVAGGPPVVDDYGVAGPGAPARVDRWDTSIGTADGDLSALAHAIVQGHARGARR
jgi:hypothetical protein